MHCNDEWKPVIGYEGLYEVSNSGLVRSIKTGHRRLLTSKYNRFTGYYAVDLRKDGVCSTKTIHRLVAMAFVPNPDELPCVNHIDEDKANNNASNLEWCDVAYNNQYSAYRRRKPVIVKDVDGNFIASFASVNIAASMLGVCKSAISSALNGTHNTCSGLHIEYLEGEDSGISSDGHGAIRLGEVGQPQRLRS